jgi:hypothetical protein
LTKYATGDEVLLLLRRVIPISEGARALGFRQVTVAPRGVPALRADSSSKWREPTAAPAIVAIRSGTRLNGLGNHHALRLASADDGGTPAVIEECVDPTVAVPLHYQPREDKPFDLLEER